LLGHELQVLENGALAELDRVTEAEKNQRINEQLKVSYQTRFYLNVDSSQRKVRFAIG
jgi:hypothetical protein